jgi:PAS domain S-box-containing protein
MSESCRLAIPGVAPLNQQIDFDAAMEAAGAGIAVADASGHFEFANPAFCRLTGYSVEELPERDLLSILHPEHRDDAARIIADVLAGEKGDHAIEQRLLRADGSTIWVRNAISAIVGIDGRVTSLVSVIQDVTDHRNSRQALEDSEGRYRALFDESPTPIYVFDNVTLQFLAVNQMALKRYGYTLEEFLALKWLDIRPKSEIPGAMRVWRDGKDTGKGFSRHQSKDGTVFDVEVAWHSIQFDGRFARVVIVKDVTESRRAEERIRENEEKFRSTFEQAAVGMAHVSLGGRWMRVNQKLCSILGYTPGELIRKSFQDITPPEDLDTSSDLRRRLISGETDTATVERRCVQANGSLIWAKVTTSLVRTPEGEPAYFIMVVEDISPAKKVELELQRSEARFRALTENSADRTVILDAVGVITYVSASSTRIFGFAPEEVAGVSAFEFVHPDDLKRAIDSFEELVRRPGGSVQVRYRARHKDGRYLWVDCRAVNALENPAVEGVVLNERDITEIKDMEEQFLRAQRLESVGTLASGVAHDLNNILAPILMSAPMLRMDLDETMRENLVSTIEASAQRGADIVRQILTFTRGIAGERLLLQPIHILKEVCHITQETFPKNISIIPQYNDLVWPVYGDPTQLHQLLMNMAVNARDAMPDGGTLTISAENVEVDEQYAATLRNGIEPGNYIAWTIKDTGMGIPAHIQDRIFDPFFTTKEVGKGTGLGLSTVIGIVRGHHGALSLESEPGRGTKFTIYLPATPGEYVAGKDANEPEQAQGNGETILLVDDEKGVLEMSRLVLERAGYRIETAMDGIEGLAYFAKHTDEIDLVITDIHMPNFDGISLIKAMRQLSPNAPIIGSTGQTSEGEEEKLRSLGVHQFLKKPYSKRQLLTAVAELLAAAAMVD